jgi:3-oxoacid CoA-transferase subunit A
MPKLSALLKMLEPGKVTIVEVEQIVETGTIDPDQVHLAGIFVHRIVLNAKPEKRIEQRTVRAKA